MKFENAGRRAEAATSDVPRYLRNGVLSSPTRLKFNQFRRNTACKLRVMPKPWDLRDRTMEFAVAVYRFCRALPRTDEARDIARQLRRAATSVAANYRASRRGKSHADFASKVGTVIEEADESLFWLEFVVRVELAAPATVRPLSGEANELVSIFTTAQKTARSQMPAEKRPPSP